MPAASARVFCANVLELVRSQVRIPRPPASKTVMLEAELLVDGSWRYSSYVRGTTLAHSELGGENILKVVVPDLQRDAVGLEQERLRQREALLSHTLFGRRFRFFGQKSDHSCRDVKAYLVADVGEGPLGAAWRSVEEAQEQLAHFSQVGQILARRTPHIARQAGMQCARNPLTRPSTFAGH